MSNPNPKLLNATITTAVTGVAGSVFTGNDGGVGGVTIQANFTYGSGGTTAKVWVQTSLDKGATWIDAGYFSFTTASARQILNLRAGTSITTAATATDGPAAAVVDGIIGPQWRAKLTTTGTYAGGTTLAVDIYLNGAASVIP